MSTIKDDVVAILQGAVEKAGSQRKAAEQLDITHSALSNWLAGRRGKQADVILSAIEKAGGRIVCGETPPRKKEIIRNHHSDDAGRVEALERQIELLEKHIELLERHIRLLEHMLSVNGEKAPNPGAVADVG